jgi:hypothetical protein
MSGAMIQNPNEIEWAVMRMQLSALKLECLGMRRRGVSAYKWVKDTYGLKGSKSKVYEDFSILVAKMAKDLQNLQ